VTKAAFAIPGDLSTPTGGYAYDRHVMAALPARGVAVRHLPLPGGFPFPSARALEETGRLLAAVPVEEALVIDGLALGVLAPALLANVTAPIIAMHHHPLGLETGLTPEQSRALLACEKAATAFARRVIVTSQTTAETLAELGFAPPPPVTVALPGLELGARSRGSGGDAAEIVCVGTIVPRKGYDILVAALATLPDEPWRCTIVGSLDRDLACVAALRAQIAAAGLEDRVHLAGALDSEAVSALLSRSDLFALASRYEGYGMVFAEAMAHGLPVLATRAPAIPATVPPEAGILVEPDNPQALADALSRLMRDPALRQRLGDGGWAHAKTLPGWQDTAAIIAGVISEVADGRLLG
jgi:glycosyltransferase involved in cell wall biosynthesis